MEIQGFPSYLIYPDGRVWSKKSNKFLKLRDDKQGYKQVILYGETKKQFKVHRLVAIHYIPNPENKPTVDHINRNPSDNRVENLRWATMKEQRHNQGDSNCSSGHKWITYCNNEKKWKYTRRQLDSYNCCKRFKSKTVALQYKFIHLLKMNFIWSP